MSEASMNMGHRGHDQVASEEEKQVNMLNGKGFWEGGAIPNTYSDAGNLASFQLELILNPKPRTQNPKPTPFRPPIKPLGWIQPPPYNSHI